jgi:hypothetical protein
MSATARVCKHSQVQHIRKFLAYAKRTVNEAWIFPPLNAYRYLVALALYSKCLTVAEAILVLLDAGFADEAFGLTRTLVDISFTLHYISNKDTEERAQLFYQFHRKDVGEWAKMLREYWPQLIPGVDAAAVDSSVLRKYPRPHSWSGKALSDMAMEPSTTENDPATGQPFVHNLGYRLIFRWTSHYVHPTILALRNHIVKPGHDNFIVHSGRGQDLSDLASFLTASTVAVVMIAFYRTMDLPQPARLSKWAGVLVEHLANRHEHKRSQAER